MNKVFLRGNITRTPEVKTIRFNEDKETKVTNFTVAVSRVYQKANGDRDKDVTYVLCEAWDTGAEAISKQFIKGDSILIEGSLKTESWERDGQKRSVTKVRVSSFEKLNYTSFDKETNKEDEIINDTPQ